MMEIDTVASPAGEVDTQATAPADATTEASTQAEGTVGSTTDTSTTEDDGIAGLLTPQFEDVEVDYDGAKYKVPAPLKDALLRQADYTTKTQDLADQRRQLDTARQQVQDAQQLSAAEIRAFSKLDSLNTQIAEFNGINWADLDHSDPQVQHAKGLRDELLREHSALSGQINGHMTAKQARAQQEAAKEREDVDRSMSARVKDWGTEKRSQFEQFAVSQGVPAEYAKNASAVEFNLIRLAMIGAQTETQRTAALRAAAAAKVQPANEVGAAGTGTSDFSKMSMEQYAAARAAGKV